MSEKLKPCPFCGPRNVKPDICESEIYKNYWRVCCGGCAGSTGISDTKEGAIKAWNNRPVEKMELDKEKVATVILNVQESLEKGGRNIHLFQSDRRLIAEAICTRFRPASVDKLVEALRKIVNGEYDNAHDPKCAARIAEQALAEHEKGQVKA